MPGDTQTRSEIEVSLTHACHTIRALGEIHLIMLPLFSANIAIQSMPAYLHCEVQCFDISAKIFSERHQIENSNIITFSDLHPPIHIILADCTGGDSNISSARFEAVPSTFTILPDNSPTHRHIHKYSAYFIPVEQSKQDQADEKNNSIYVAAFLATACVLLAIIQFIGSSATFSKPEISARVDAIIMKTSLPGVSQMDKVLLQRAYSVEDLPASGAISVDETDTDGDAKSDEAHIECIPQEVVDAFNKFTDSNNITIVDEITHNNISPLIFDNSRCRRRITLKSILSWEPIKTIMQENTLIEERNISLYYAAHEKIADHVCFIDHGNDEYFTLDKPICFFLTLGEFFEATMEVQDYIETKLKIENSTTVDIVDRSTD